MKTFPVTILLAAASIIGSSPAFAAEPAPGNTQPAQAPPSAKAEATEPAASDATAQAADDEAATDKSADEEPGPVKGSTDKRASPQRFIPSEQVRADFDVSFPIDM